MAAVSDANDVTTTGSPQLVYTAPAASEGPFTVRITPRTANATVSLFIVADGETQGDQHLVVMDEAIPQYGTRIETGFYLETDDKIYFETNVANVTVHINGYVKDTA